MFGPSYCKKHRDAEFIFFWKPKQENGIFSQWAYTPFADGKNIYFCAEQYMMSQKALLFGDKEIFDEIMAEKSDPGKLKALGQKVRGFDDSIWNEERYGIVVRGSYLKFSNKSYTQYLIETGSAILVEASPYDRIWGVGVDARTAENIDTWKGQNLLGQALMEARKMLVDEREKFLGSSLY